MFELLFYVEPTFGEDQFDAEVIHVGINDVMNTTVTGSLLQNILKREARYKMHGNILMTFCIEMVYNCHIYATIY